MIYYDGNILYKFYAQLPHREGGAMYGKRYKLLTHIFLRNAQKD